MKKEKKSLSTSVLFDEKTAKEYIYDTFKITVGTSNEGMLILSFIELVKIRNALYVLTGIDFRLKD